MWITIGPKYQKQRHLILRYFGGLQYPVRHHFPQENNEWGIAMLKFRIGLHQISVKFPRLKGLKLQYSKLDVLHSDDMPK
jgi:hypothetical protein